MSARAHIYSDEAIAQASLACVIRELTIFCREYGRDCHRTWTDEKLFKYLAFQWLSGGLARVCDDLGELSGVIVVWPTMATEVLRRELAGEFHFSWQTPAPAGDAYMIGDVVTADRYGLFRLLQTASARWPDWKMRRLFTHRRGKLVELTHAQVERFYGISSRHS